MTKELLAINGGEPVLGSQKFPWPVVTEEIKANVERALKEGTWGQYESHWTEELIETLGNFFNSEFVTLCSSGTIAVELALRGLGVQAEDEVILAGYDFPGNFRAIEAIGAKPVLVDVVENGWVMDPTQIESAISEQTRALVVSHLHGQIADLSQIRTILTEHNASRKRPILIVEDSCQVPGAKADGSPLGSIGDVGVLSFGGSKLLSAGRGGAVLSNNPDFHQRAKIYANRGNDAFPFSQLQAAALLPQLATLDSLTNQRLENAKQLGLAVDEHSLVQGLTQFTSESNLVPAFYKLPWLLRDKTPGWTRTEFIAAVGAEGVPIGEGFRGFLRRSPRRCRKIGTLVQSQIAAQQTVLLQHPVLLESPEVIDSVARAFHKVLDYQH